MAKVLLTGASGKTGKNVLKNLNSVTSPEDKIFVFQHVSPIDMNLTDGRKNISIVTSLPHTREYDVAIHFAAIFIHHEEEIQ